MKKSQDKCRDCSGHTVALLDQTPGLPYVPKVKIRPSSLYKKKKHFLTHKRLFFLSEYFRLLDWAGGFPETKPGMFEINCLEFFFHLFKSNSTHTQKCTNKYLTLP